MTVRAGFLASVLVVASVSACASSRSVINAAPPLKVCGQVLNDTPAGANIEDASQGPVTIDTGTSGAGIYLRLARGCTKGATIEVPSGAATIVESAKTQDGRLAAVGIHPLRAQFTVAVTNADGLRYAVSVSL